VLTFVNYNSKLASLDLAADRGACPAVRCGRSRYADPAFLARFAAADLGTVTTADWTKLAARIAETGQLRNSSTIAVPPTGRSAAVVGASTGIEPLFRLTVGESRQVHPLVTAALRSAGRRDLLGHVVATGRLPHDSALPIRLSAVLETATQISPSGHLAMAAAVQACVDEAVSKTVNLPASADVTAVFDTYLAAWEAGCKGVTVYVDGSRRAQPKAL
jgi:ribonucleoside-diphosphate reductase alpha chain